MSENSEDECKISQDRFVEIDEILTDWQKMLVDFVREKGVEQQNDLEKGLATLLNLSHHVGGILLVEIEKLSKIFSFFLKDPEKNFHQLQDQVLHIKENLFRL